MTVEEMIRAEALRQGVPPDLAVAVARRESGLNPNIGDGTSGEVGLFQVKPSTAADLGVYNLRDLQSNIAAGVGYLKWNYDYFGDWTAAVLGYNAGPGNVQRGTISQQARSYLAWIESQVPSLFGGPAPVVTVQNQAPKGGSGTELLDPGFWRWPDLSSPYSPYTAGEGGEQPQGPSTAMLATGAVVGLAVVLWAAG